MAREKGHDGRGIGGIRPREAASTITGGRASADRTLVYQSNSSTTGVQHVLTPSTTITVARTPLRCE